MTNQTQRRYSRQGLWTLFLICAVPLHIWTFILAFRDFSWVSERTSAWDAIGVISYGLSFALLESLVVFLAVAILGFLIPRYWDEDHRIALLSTLVLIAALWAIAGQLYFLLEIAPPPGLVSTLAKLDHPVRVMYAGLAVVVAPTILVPAYLILRSEKAFSFAKEMSNRLGMLMMLYLVVDVAAILIVLFRNLQRTYP